MQVTELSADGLKRSYKVVVTADEIEQRLIGRLEEIKKTVKMPGFRPGKVPMPLLKQRYGKSLLGEILEQSVNEGSQRAIDENNLRPALRPKIEVTAFDEGEDLEFDMDVEVLPQIPEVDLKAIKIERPVAKVPEEQVADAALEFAKSQTTWSQPDPARPSAEGDRLTIDFVGKVDGELFDGGSADGFKLVLGAGTMIPGFEEPLTGVSIDDDVTVNVTFPENYGKEDLAGKAAEFAVKVRDIEAPDVPAIDEAFAEKVGFESLEELNEAFRSRLQERLDSASRFRVKRKLLDALADGYPLTVPEGMIDMEFEAIWKQLTDEMERVGQTFEEEGEKSEEATKGEYRSIAERRVRLGLILSEIGSGNELDVTPDELGRAVADQARRYPGQEKQVFEFFQNNVQAREQLRAPLFEDKVVDFILEIADITDTETTPEDLLKDPDEDDAEAAA